jgi:phosphohistidine swiveling domain-containing protein
MKSFGKDSRRWKKELEKFIQVNYHHGEAELELTTPRWGEKPEIITDMVKGMIHSGNAPLDPMMSEKKQYRIYIEEKDRVEERIKNSIWKYRLRYVARFPKKLKILRKFLSYRERMRECSTRSYYVLRLNILELGRRMGKWGMLNQPQDIFFLHIEEILNYLKRNQIKFSNKLSSELSFPGDLNLLYEVIHLRKIFYEGQRDFKAPNEFGQGVLQKHDESYEMVIDGVETLKGIPCSGGIYEGVARVILNLDEIHQLQKGDILVTKFTDPGWTVALGLVSGIVTEVGGVLSHAAVIGREYGIPAILNIPGVSSKIKSGQKIRIDGNTGLIYLLKG